MKTKHFIFPTLTCKVEHLDPITRDPRSGKDQEVTIQDHHYEEFMSGLEYGACVVDDGVKAQRPTTEQWAKFLQDGKDLGDPVANYMYHLLCENVRNG